MRRIDADALMDYCNNQKDKTIDANDIARFPTIGGWISVKDRLPIDYAPVFVWIDIGTGIKNGIPAIGKYDVYSCNEWNVYGLDMDRRTKIKITHWMQLPESP